jgi:hypothetical protein
MDSKIMNPLAAAYRLGGELVKWGADGFKLSDQSAERLEICHTCPQYNDGRCLQCGCSMQLKTRLSTAHCPLRKW